MYSVYSYGRMIADRVRMTAYETALRRSITPETVVMDIGTGPGVFALLACKYGARRVYAIEPGDVIQLAKEISAQNGWTDRIIFIQDSSLNVRLDRKVDVLISDIRGSLPFFERSIVSIIDARDRFLAADGVLIPEQDHLWCGWLNSYETYRLFDVPWKHDQNGFDMTPGDRLVVNTFVYCNPPEQAMFLERKLLATINYYEMKDPNLSAGSHWVSDREGTIHGFVLWFDCKAAEGAEFSNAPGNPESVYGRCFFPLSNPVEIVKGDRISLELEAKFIEDDYVWNWNTTIEGSNKQIGYQQSSFYGDSYSVKTLHKMSSSFVATLGEEGKIDLLILEMMNRGMPLGEIAHSVSAKNPEKYPTWRAALSKVGKVSQKYSI